MDQDLSLKMCFDWNFQLDENNENSNDSISSCNLDSEDCFGDEENYLKSNIQSLLVDN